MGCSRPEAPADMIEHNLNENTAEAMDSSSSSGAATAPTVSDRQPQDDINSQWDTIKNNILHSTKTQVPTITQQPKQPWIQQTTWQLIEDRNTARQRQGQAKELQLHKDIRKAARKDRKG